ncbi:hemoglobin/transferrin/lactoferrin receptor protein [Constrictibacter sp. MBR-5]|jgi:hemoglobin/transferrin/lactoferrin receptor protein|uniref:TonB-dependent hemoglobin/transferrin/lactoferrin family receptor n=1 Tax=Constrictibacter sp. MBR-5 TaxID=3156467 RepID=UPI00339B0D61
MVSARSARIRLLCGTASLLVLGAGGAAAQQTGERTGKAPAAVELAPLEVEGAAPPETDETTVRIEKEALDQHMVQSIQDLGRRLDAGVGYSRATNSINLRGLGENRVLTTIDGIRQTWMEDPRSVSGGVNAFAFDSLSRIDIVRGADSSLYGSGALGGVVALKTLDPEDLLPGETLFGALSKAGYDSADDSWRASSAVAGRVGDTFVLLQGGFRSGHALDNEGDVGGTGDARTKSNPADYEQYDFLFKLAQRFDGGHRIGLTGELFNRDETEDNRVGQTGTYQIGNYDTGEEVDRKRVSLSYDFTSPDRRDVLDQANVIAYWQRQTLNNTVNAIRDPDPRGFAPGGQYYAQPFGTYKRDNELEQTSYGLQGDAKKLLDTGGSMGGTTHTVRFGGEVYRQDTTQYSHGEDNCPDVDWTTIPQPYGPQTCRFLHTNASDMPDVESLAFGFYVEDEIGTADGRFSLTPGVRFDWYEHKPQETSDYVNGPNFDGTMPDSTSDSKLSPKLRATWHATPELDVFGQWAQAFRAPSATELYQDYGAPGSYARVGNPDLKTETSNGFEIGAKLNRRDFGGSVTGFYNFYKNFIDEVQLAPPGGDYPIGGVIGYENRARVEIYGAEASGYWNVTEHWRTWASFAWAVGRDTDEDEYVNSIPALRAILGLGYATEAWGADASITAAAARDDVSGGGFEAPSYKVVDLTAWWKPAFVPGAMVQAGLFNVFDEKYWNALDVPDDTAATREDYYTEPGRSFRVTLTHQF